MSSKKTVPQGRPFRPTVTEPLRRQAGPRAAELAASAAVHGSRVPETRTSASPFDRRLGRWSSRWYSPPFSLYNAAVPRPRSASRPVLAWALAFASMTWSGLASAQAPTPAPAPTQPRGTTSKAPGPQQGPKPSPGGKKQISLDDEFLVEGKLEKPSAFYVLRRSSTDYDWSRLDATMTPLVLESVWDPLF